MEASYLHVVLCLGCLQALGESHLDGARTSATRPHGAEGVSREASLAEYPRPQMLRCGWMNLNGLWEYGITHRDKTNGGALQGKVLVPFPIESALSGVRGHLTEQQRLWYRRKFTIPPGWKGRRVLLHFEAVDWESRVWVNEKEQGTHRGGYERFSFDITDSLVPEGEQELVVSVYDPSQGAYQPRGRQALRPTDNLHSACSGIWQTVWLEPVNNDWVASIELVPDLGAGVLNVTVAGGGATNELVVEAVALEGRAEIAQTRGAIGQPIRLVVPNAKPWSPTSPFLYDLKVILWRDGTKVDEVASYFGMRKISVGPGKLGLPVLKLNGEDFFQLGVLDQGYWPEGIYTPPSDEALRSDIEAAKQLGFNLCRKHEKIEADRFYYWCDKLGMLVWQDMPSSDRKLKYEEAEVQRRLESASEFETGVQALIKGKGNHPCIVAWIPFPEKRGRFDTARILAWVKVLDPSRLVVSTGGPDLGAGDVQLVDYLGGASVGSRARVLGCGRFPVLAPGHQWSDAPYRGFPPLMTEAQFLKQYRQLASRLSGMREKYGLAGAIFSQLTDVEQELDGLLTYDRVYKANVTAVSAANKDVLEPAAKK